MKANKAELEAALNSSMISTLTADASDAKTIQASVKGFIESSQSNKLEGNIWNTIRDKFTIYDSLFEERSQLSGDLASTIKDALTKLIACMGEYEELDYTCYEEIKTLKEQINGQIADINSKMNQTTTKKEEDADGNITEKTVNVFDVAELRRDLEYWQNELNEATKLINKLDEFKGVYTSAEGTLSGAYAKISAFGSKVSAITTGGKYAYVKANPQI